MLNIQENIDLLPYNTFQVSCIAKYFVVVRSVADIQTLVMTDVWQSEENRLFLGWGSNMLFVSSTYDGIVVKNECMGKDVIGARKDVWSYVRTGAWEDRDDFVHRSIEQWYCGIENLVSIPGTVGAAPVQNIWAYGVEVESCIESVEWVDMVTGEVRVFSHHECGFGYRESVFKTTLKGRILITHIHIRLHRYTVESYQPVLKYGIVSERLWDQVPTPLLVAQTIAQIRSEKLPDWKEVGTAGSFFKNPIVSEKAFERLEKEFGIRGWKVERKSETSPAEGDGIKNKKSEYWSTTLLNSELWILISDTYKLSAGQLVDMAGMKWYRLWEIGVSPDHALVLINYGERDGSKFLELIGLIQEKVEVMFGVRLEAEVNML